MSIASQKGRNFEHDVAKMIRSKLAAKITRDSRSGAGTNKSDISDYFNDIPLSIECKNQETVKIKEWFLQADAASSFNRVPTVVFHADSEILATLRFSELLNFLVEIADQKAEIDDLRKPIEIMQHPSPGMSPVVTARIVRESPQKTATRLCRNGHIADENGYCQQKDCKFRRGYVSPKAKKKGKS